MRPARRYLFGIIFRFFLFCYLREAYFASDMKRKATCAAMLRIALSHSVLDAAYRRRHEKYGATVRIGFLGRLKHSRAPKRCLMITPRPPCTGKRRSMILLGAAPSPFTHALDRPLQISFSGFPHWPTDTSASHYIAENHYRPAAQTCFYLVLITSLIPGARWLDHE